MRRDVYEETEQKKSIYLNYVFVDCRCDMQRCSGGICRTDDRAFVWSNMDRFFRIADLGYAEKS